jgi:hypothetical protein
LYLLLLRLWVLEVMTQKKINEIREKIHSITNESRSTSYLIQRISIALQRKCREPTCSTPRDTTLHYATRRKYVQTFNKDLNAIRTHLFHAIRQHATRRGTTFARSNRPDFLVRVLKRVVPPP